ncbi:haloacid dehalogenase-like hydrolase domain-containing protein Sgpp [Gossypium australe]|uniref:Haloacid dehalogenase-like hydrolase domain-containing protein Sgpp n=1 Tax=Gossypium australe TaxID=47621 RepID=A0A5B6VJI4_9ROSI|nr:haloacid dehalogenase-like hydrolase domain-containing protein Sgpp [Gossypium australe]
MTAGENSVQSKKSVPDLTPLEAVLFDVDGTLCDSDPLHYQVFREMLPQIGFNNGVPIDEEYFIKNIAGKHNPDIAVLLYPDDIPRGIKFMEDKEAMFRRLASENLPPIKGLYKLTKWIEDRGLKRAAEVIASAPNPYLKALEVLKVSKDHTFVCEDSVSGIKAGVAAGMLVVGLTIRNFESVLMEANPAILIKDYEDPKLWEALEELDKRIGSSKTSA